MKVGILGAGNIANHMAEAIQGLDTSVEGYAVAARDLARAEEFAQKWGITRACGSYEEMLQDPAVDLVYVATPHIFHYEHAKLCLEHGKSVICEKPFTVNAKQAEELYRIAAEKKLLITEAIWTRYMPSRRMIDEIMQSNVIGEITSLSANLGYDLHNVPRMQELALAGGALLDLSVYTINFAFMFFGSKVKEVSSSCVKLDTGADAQDSITFLYEDGRMAVLYTTMLAEPNRLGEINGTKGCIEVQNINNCEEIRVRNEKREIIKVYEIPAQINGYEYEILACRDALEQGLLECPQMPHSETLEVLKMMDRIRKDWGITFPQEGI
ncbi:MAG: Gfo/Idh/MocA family protein [Lachnospiraceae bacterium]